MDPHTEKLFRLSELMMTLNCFSFNYKFYSQERGVKMGCFCANLVIVEQKFFEQFTGHEPTQYLQYIDAIFGIANCTVEELQLFIYSFFTFHPVLEYTYFSPCLKHNIFTHIFELSNFYLEYNSSHTKHCKKFHSLFVANET